jgi:hypothetical protein
LTYTPFRVELIRKVEGWFIRKGDLELGPFHLLSEIEDNVKDLSEKLDVRQTDILKAIFVTRVSSSSYKPSLIDTLKTVSIGDVEITPLMNDYVSIHPAIGVTEDCAYVGVWLPCEVVFTNKKKKKMLDEEEEKKSVIKENLFLVIQYINGKREILLANDEVLRGRGWKLAYRPIKLKTAWGINHIKNFLEGASCNQAETFKKILDQWYYYIEFSDEREYIFHALWDVGTYFYTIFKTYPYCYIGGIKRTGKTKVLTLHSCLAHNAFFSNNMSTSSIYRLIQNARGTLLIDETEKLSKKDRALEFRSILLAGYKKGAMVYRIEKTKKEILIPEAFDVYSPKAIANIGGIEDVMEDRCIVTIMKRGRDRKVMDREIDIMNELWSELRSELYMFFLEHWKEIKAIYDEMCELNELSELVNFMGVKVNNEKLKFLSSRELELWKPIFTLAKYFDDFPTKFTSSESSLSSLIFNLALEKAEHKHIENMTETGEVILTQILLNLVTTDDYYPVKTIKDKMVEQFDEEQSWLNTHWVGRALRRLGFKNKRRVGTGYQYFLTPNEVKDLAERMGIETNKNSDVIARLKKWISEHKDSEGLIPKFDLAEKIMEMGFDPQRIINKLLDEELISPSPKLDKWLVMS